jgi:type I restriction enzyme S subunit
VKTRTVHLEALCERIDYGFTASADFSVKEPRLLRITDIQEGSVDWNHVPGCRITPEEEADKRLSAGDIVFARTGATTGKCFLIEHAPRAVFASYLIRLRATHEILPHYLYAFFQSEQYWHQIRSAVRGAAQGGVNSTTLSSLVVPLPDLTEQRRIAQQLEQVYQLRRTRRYTLELTDTFLPAAFLKLFGDPAENPRAFDQVQVQELFADSRDGAKCGPFGSALKKHEYVAEGVPVWTMNNVGANEFIEDGCLFITPQKFEELAVYDAQNGDILVSRAGTVGRMAIVQTKYPRSIIHSNIIRLSLNDTKILPIYFVALMTWFAPRVARLKRGQEDAYTFMSTGSLGELQIPLPPFPLQQKFAALVERVEHLRAVQREALRQAEHLFASLLDRAFSD